MLNYKLTVYVGDVGEYLSIAAISFDPTAFLLEHTNVTEFITSNLTNDTTVYTSLGDLDTGVFYNVLLLADEIVYVPPAAVWSDKKTIDVLDPTESIQGLTERLLIGLSYSKLVKNIELAYLCSQVIPLVDSRKSTEPQLWFAGCSFTHGVGVETHERYGNILSKQLNLNASFLTRAGSSITWAADQILRSNICKDDIIIWGITSNERVTAVGNNKLLPGVNINTVTAFSEITKYVLPDMLFSETTFYENIYAIERVINYCNKIGAKLFLFGILVSNNLLRFLTSKENFYYESYKLKFTNKEIITEYIDLGTDNLHPGPLQHQQYTDICQSSLKKLQYI